MHWIGSQQMRKAKQQYPAANADADREAYVKFTVTEPLLLSPFVFANPQSNNQGMHGVQNMSFNMNLGDTKRIWRHANTAGTSVIKSVEIVRTTVDRIEGVVENGLVGIPPSPVTKQCISKTISLNQIPDKLIIYVRKQSQTWSDTDSFLPISGININWNNNTGVCSSFKQVDLWRCSVEAGSNQTFDEFRGDLHR